MGLKLAVVIVPLGGRALIDVVSDVYAVRETLAAAGIAAEQAINPANQERYAIAHERFAWICDVFVAEAHRGKGLAKAMVRYALEEPEHREIKRWLLATADAHAIYAEVGFIPLPSPERWMVYLPTSSGIE